MEPYKLKAELKDFILQKAKEHPELGCRKLTSLIQETFQANISKSTISFVLKSAGLNKAIGRRRIHPKAPPAPVSTIQNLEAISQPKEASNANVLSELLLRGSPPQALLSPPANMQAAARNDDETLQETEQLPFQPQETQECGVWFLKAAELCLGEIGQTGAAIPQLFSELVSRSVEALAIKFILEDNSFFFIDAAGHSVWTTERIPRRLSVGLHKSRVYLDERVLSGREPLILQAVPGFDAPTPAFLNFIEAFQAEKPEKAIKSIELYSTDNLLIDTIKFTQPQEKRYFIVGLWPWQYKNRELSLSIRMIPICEADEHKKLDILTNLELEKQSNEQIIGQYLSYWSSLEKGYQNFLDEIGHFIRNPKIQSTVKCPILPTNGEDLSNEQLLMSWRMILNSYCQRHFFPPDYQEMDFLVLQERFYHLKCATDSTESAFLVKLALPDEFSYLNDLQYACQRVSEAGIRLENGQRLAFEIH